MNLNNFIKQYFAAAILIFSAILFSGCEVIGGIFKAGVWTGVILIAIILAIVFWLMSKFRK